MPVKKTSTAPARARVRRGSEADADKLRDELLAAALALFMEGGVESVTMRALATKVGVSAMTPYRYFEDKNHLLRGISRGSRLDTVDVLLWSWIAAIIGFLSASHFKLDHYVFPAAPALSVG